MNKFSKNNRRRSHQRGVEFVKSFNGIHYFPTYDTEINIPGKNAKVDVTLNLGTHPIPELTDISSLEGMKATMENSRKIRFSTVPAPASPASPAPEQKPKRKITPWGWIAIAAGVVIGVVGGGGLVAKKSA